jgi:hypothetical protein
MPVAMLVVPERFVCCGRTVPGRGRERYHEDFFLTKEIRAGRTARDEKSFRDHWPSRDYLCDLVSREGARAPRATEAHEQWEPRPTKITGAGPGRVRR